MRLVLATLLGIGLQAVAYGQIEATREGQRAPVAAAPRRAAPPGFFSTGRDLMILAKAYEEKNSPGFESKADTKYVDATSAKALAFQLYVEGVLDGFGYAAWEWELTDRPFEIPPGGVFKSQICSVVVKYLREHPERLHHRKEDLVIEAMAQAFPPEQK